VPPVAGATLAWERWFVDRRSKRARLGSRLRIAAAATLLALAGGIACNTPSVPLPPPLITSLSFQASGMNGMVVMQGMPTPRHANVRFYVFNRSRKDGVITGAAADGSFTTSPFAGSAGDTVQLYYDTPAGERSQDLCTTLQLNAPLLSSTCF
jgi:hypothetical protein